MNGGASRWNMRIVLYAEGSILACGELGEGWGRIRILSVGSFEAILCYVLTACLASRGRTPKSRDFYKRSICDNFTRKREVDFLI
jgi:hypothetical protein